MARARAFGGHLADGTIVFAAEFVIQELKAEQSLNRLMDEETGLFLWPKKLIAVFSFRPLKTGPIRPCFFLT